MAMDTQPPFDGVVRGDISVFLTVNKFRVELSDGQFVDAVLPDELVEKILPLYVGPPVTDRIGVLVELRERPAMHRIVALTGNSGWCGAPQAPRR